MSEYAKFYAAIEAAGHLLKRDESGEVDGFALDYEYHNGPMCELCYDSWCQHCHDEHDKIESCSVGVIESTCTVMVDRAAIAAPKAGAQ